MAVGTGLDSPVAAKSPVVEAARQVAEQLYKQPTYSYAAVEAEAEEVSCTGTLNLPSSCAASRQSNSKCKCDAVSTACAHLTRVQQMCRKLWTVCGASWMLSAESCAA